MNWNTNIIFIAVVCQFYPMHRNCFFYSPPFFQYRSKSHHISSQGTIKVNLGYVMNFW